MPSFFNTACALLSAGQLATAATYTLQDNYDKTNFFKGFEFFSGADPTTGFVQYQDAASASAQGLAGYHEGGIYLGSDHTTMNPANGRASTRVYSKKTYDQMFMVVDVVHMPVGCGTWPALWSYGKDWPGMGEIDVLEGVNSQSTNQITLHTNGSCTMAQGSAVGSTKFSATADCSAGDGSTGCPQTTTSTNNFGAGLNAGGGGIYAMLWDNEAISVYHFPRNSTTANSLTSNSSTVDTSILGMPLATFVGGDGCDITEKFFSHHITINTDFCGSWAGQDSVWSADAECSAKAPTCQEYVANNPEAFVDAYWLFNSIKVYTTSGSASPTATASGSAVSATASGAYGSFGVYGSYGKKKRGLPFRA
ncbi:hypothetical protein VMCG_01105 [Cytospora schulzeri]|uniref:GH16 domain-containing protein n=1 Tax=Cytospora schulzeri TaxID=448051 RepID=A0A423X6D9_9PEZI|nr:hypothetical protein VMCG_01105 [Valsa malicola]